MMHGRTDFTARHGRKKNSRDLHRPLIYSRSDATLHDKMLFRIVVDVVVVVVVLSDFTTIPAKRAVAFWCRMAPY